MAKPKANPLPVLVEGIVDNMNTFHDLSSVAKEGKEKHGAKSAASKARKISLVLQKQLKEFRQLSVEEFK